MIGFDSQTFYNHPSGGIGRDVIICGADMSSSTNTANNKKNILILGKASVQGLDERALTCANIYLFVNGTEIYKFTAKDTVINPYNLCLVNISKDFSRSNMKKTGFNGNIYDFSVDYDSINVDNIKDIHKYLMKKNEIV